MVNITEKASEQIKTVMQNESLTDSFLKVFIASKSCQGIKYGLDFQKELNNETENMTEISGLKVVILKNEEPFIDGLNIDYIDNELEKGFSIINTKGIGGCSGCSCGT